MHAFSSRVRAGFISRARRVALALAWLALPAVPAIAFDSYIVGHQRHEEITHQAAAAAGLSETTGNRLAESVGNVDYAETRALDPRPGHPWVLSPSPAYRANHHFDRAPGVSTQSAFMASAAYMRARRAEAFRLFREG